MKKLFTMTSLLFLLCLTAKSQDVIYTVKDDSIICKVTEITEKTIKYSCLGESVLHNISKFNVTEIKFESGRTQKISEKIIIEGEMDWEKIHITNNSEDVVGLTKVKEYSERSFALSAPESRAKEKVLENVKKAAAIDGCHILLIISFSSTRGNGIIADSRANIVVIGYKY